VHIICTKVFIYLLQVCTKCAFAHHKVCIKCARCRLCRLCRLGAHSTHHVFLGWSVDWGQYTDDGPLARAYVEEPAASSWLPVIVAFFQRKELPRPRPQVRQLVNCDGQARRVPNLQVRVKPPRAAKYRPGPDSESGLGRPSRNDSVSRRAERRRLGVTGSMGRQAARAETRAGGIGAPVTQALTYLHAGHLIIWVNPSAALRETALLPESAGQLVSRSRRAVPTRAGAQSEGPQ
jgi:hypothetical protein